MYQVKKRWTNAKKIEVDGYIYDSKFEASYAQELELRKKAKDIKDWKRQVTIPLVVNGYEVCTYRIDFIIKHNDGTEEWVECKGWASPIWRIKWKLLEALKGNDPNIQLTIIKQKSFRTPKPKKI